MKRGPRKWVDQKSKMDAGAAVMTSDKSTPRSVTGSKRKSTPAPLRAFWFVLGLLSLGLGALGVVLPLLPTTPFVLLAAFSFARSSETFHAWLLHHRIFGPLIKNWNENGSISRRTKIVSIISMLAIIALSLALNAPRLVIIIQAVVLSVTAVFLISRPLPKDY